MRTLLWRLRLTTRLSSKVFVPVAVFSALIIAGVAVLAYDALHHAITLQYKARVLGAALLVDHELREGDLSLEAPAAASRHITNDILTMYPGVYRVNIYARAGGAYRVVASSDPARVGAEAHSHDLEPLRTGQVALREDVENGRRVLEVTYPLRQGGRDVATLGLYASLEERDRTLAGLLGWIIVVALLALVGLFGITYLVARSAILAPLRSVLTAAERVAAGDLRTDVPLHREGSTPLKVRDEVTRFARALNVLIGRIRQAQAQTRDLAIRDPLTGLHNRRYFEEVIQRELAQARRHGQPFSLAVVDVDGLRDVNNQFGHLAGDEYLREAAGFLGEHVRAEDDVIRWGGDEFLVLMPQTDAAQGAQITRRLKAALAERAQGPGGKTKLSLSIGVSVWTPGQDLESVLREADARMYEDKYASGRLRHRPRHRTVQGQFARG